MTQTDRDTVIQGFRELADFLEAHPSVPITHHTMNEFVDTREEWDAIHEAAPLHAKTTEEFMVLRRVFAGGVTIEVNTERLKVENDDECEHGYHPLYCRACNPDEPGR